MIFPVQTDHDSLHCRETFVDFPWPVIRNPNSFAWHTRLLTSGYQISFSSFISCLNQSSSFHGSMQVQMLFPLPGKSSFILQHPLRGHLLPFPCVIPKSWLPSFSSSCHVARPLFPYVFFSLAVLGWAHCLAYSRFFTNFSVNIGMNKEMHKWSEWIGWLLWISINTYALLSPQGKKSSTLQ